MHKKVSKHIMLQGFSVQNKYKLEKLEAAQVQVPASGY